MSDSEDRSSKTEAPTEKKIRDTIEKGNVPFSRELPILASLLATAIYFSFDVVEGSGRLLDFFKATFENPLQWSVTTGADAVNLFTIVGIESARFLLPATIAFIVAGVASSLVQNPPQLNFERIRPKAQNVSPKSGLRRIFGVRGVTEFGKAVFKFLMIGTIVGFLLTTNFPIILQAMYTDPVHLPAMILDLAMSLLFAVSGATVVLVAADLAFSRIHWRRDIMMSPKDIKEEHKQSEGDPMVKARQRQIGRDRARKRMMSSVPQATVVIANPTHYAIAMRYVREEGGAPMVLAKGTDLVALKIREIAEKNGIPVIEDKLLVRSMYDHVQIDQMIPPQFFKAIAEIIYFLYSKSDAPRAGIPA